MDAYVRGKERNTPVFVKGAELPEKFTKTCPKK